MHTGFSNYHFDVRRDVHDNDCTDEYRYDGNFDFGFCDFDSYHDWVCQGFRSEVHVEWGDVHCRRNKRVLACTNDRC